jgi:replicative DNA helicase
MNTISDFVQPYSTEAEQAVLGGLIIDNSAFDGDVPPELSSGWN